MAHPISEDFKIMKVEFESGKKVGDITRNHEKLRNHTKLFARRGPGGSTVAQRCGASRILEMGHVRETARRHNFNCVAKLLLSVVDARERSGGEPSTWASKRRGSAQAF